MKILLLITALALFVVIFYQKINATNKCLIDSDTTGWVFNDKGCCV